MEVGVVLLFVVRLAVHTVPVAVLQIQVVEGRGRRLKGAWSALRNRADRDGGVEGGLFRHALEEVGKLLRANDRGIAEIL